MINIFEEAFKANSELSKKQLNEAANKPKLDLTKINPKSMVSILEKHKEELGKATSVKELYNLIVKWFKEEGLDTKATRRLLTNIASKNNIEDAQFVVYNSMLAGAGLSVESKECKDEACEECEKTEEACDKTEEGCDSKKDDEDKEIVKEDVENYQPDEEILVVYNSDLEKNMDEEEVAQATEDMIGKCVCKCGVCGANYLYDITDESVSEDDVLEVDAEEFEEEPVKESIKTTVKKRQKLDESLLFKGLSLMEAEDDETDFEEAEVEELDDIDDAVDETAEEETVKLDVEPKEDEDEDRDFESVDSECPICGAKENQIVIGKIEKEDEVEFDFEDEAEEESEESEESNSEDDDSKVNVDVDVNVDTDADDNNEEDKEEVEESLDSIDADRDDKVRRAISRFKKARDDADADRDYKKDKLREDDEKYAYSTKDDPNPDPKYVIKSNVDGEICKVSTEFDAKKTIEAFKIEDKRDKSRKDKDIEYTYELISDKKNESIEYTINDKTLSKLFTKFANENYENVKSVNFTKGYINKSNEIVLEGVVNSTSGKVRNIKLISNNFKNSIKDGIIKFSEKGPFTESAEKVRNKVPFVVECVTRGNMIRVKSLKYNYVVKESKNRYSVSGRNTLFE